jgi:hypothetical protein
VSLTDATTGTSVVVADRSHFPTSPVFADGAAYVVESGLPFGGAPPGGRVWRLTDSGRELVIEGLRPGERHSGERRRPVSEPGRTPGGAYPVSTLAGLPQMMGTRIGEKRL